jgi:hypothetical protein
MRHKKNRPTIVYFIALPAMDSGRKLRPSNLIFTERRLDADD